MTKRPQFSKRMAKNMKKKPNNQDYSKLAANANFGMFLGDICCLALASNITLFAS